MPLHRAIYAIALFWLTLGFVQAPSGAAEPPRDATPQPSASPSASPTPAPALQWRSIGPAVSGGRVATVAGTDADPALFYAGAAGGGVWKSTNGGIDWSPVFDKATTQSIGAIAISPKDTRDVWVGTGEAWPRNDVIPGDGVYHSTDAGKTWTNVGLVNTSQIARVLIDPRDPRRVLVAALGDPFADNAERGVFRTLDGGKTWQKTLYAGPAVGASDLVMDPKNPDVLFAGLWRFRRSSWHLDSGGADDGIYKSTDGGATWTKLNGNGLPGGTVGRIGLAIAPSDPKRIYALIESTDGILWRSDDGGASWATVSSNTLINERPFYYSRIVVDPHDANHLFSVSVLLAESTTGGKTWHVSGKRLHGDHHDLWISANGRTILEANDGGVALSRDGGERWQWRNVLPISQFYHVGYDLEEPYHVCGGLQDNGSWCAPVRTGDDHGIMPVDWMKVSGGDGTWVVPAPHDARTIFSANGGGDNQGQIIRFDKRLASQVDVSPYMRNQNVVPPHELRYRFNWETPLAFWPQRPHVLYTAGNVVFVSEDDGQHWKPISGDLTRNLRERQTLTGGVRLDVTGAETFDTILAIAPSRIERGLIWVSTDDGLVQFTRNRGTTWTKAEIPGVDADSRIPSIEASRYASATAFVAVDRHFAGDRSPYVYVTDDYGKHWRTITAGLPHSEVHAVREDPRNPNVLYAATGKGVWWSEDRGTSWKVLPVPLPAVEVRDLAIQPRTGDLLAATHGRGMYVLDDPTPLREHAAAQAAEVKLFVPRDAQPLQRYTTTTREEAASDDAPPIAFTFWQRAPAKSPPSFEIVDARGRIVRHIAGTHEDEDGNDVPNVTNVAGFNRVTWSLDQDPPTPWRRVAKWDRGPESGAPVLSGTYTVRLTRDGAKYEQRFRVLRDRRAASLQDELRGYDFATALYGELGALDDALNGLDNVRVQLAERTSSLKNEAVAAQARNVIGEAQRIESAISSQPINDQDNDFLRDMLRERVFSMIGNLAPGTPPQAQLTEAATLQREGAELLARYHAFVNRAVTPLNVVLQSAGVAAVDLRAIPPKQKPDPDADQHARRGEEH